MADNWWRVCLELMHNDKFIYTGRRSLEIIESTKPTYNIYLLSEPRYHSYFYFISPSSHIGHFSACEQQSELVKQVSQYWHQLCWQTSFVEKKSVLCWLSSVSLSPLEGGISSLCYILSLISHKQFRILSMRQKSQLFTIF